MPTSLYGKLVLLMLALLAVVGIVLIALISHSSQLYFQEVTQDVNRQVAQKVAARREILAAGSFDQRALKRLFSELMTTHPSIEVYALDPAGKIVSFSAPPQAVVRGSVALAPIREFLSGNRLPVLGDDPRATQGRKVFSVAPVPVSGAPRAALAGYIYVVLEGQSYQSALDRLRGSYILRQTVLVGAASLAFALLAALYLLAVLTRRVRQLASAMQAFEASGFRQPPAININASTGDEIDRLEHFFSAMATRLVAQVKEIRDVDLARRELLANISHDLRTPLASLQGYVDTVLLKDEALSRAEQREFLRIAARHGERLAKLIEDLFDLARLESAQAPLNREPVSMAELVQDSLQKQRLPAQSKGVSLESDLAQDLPLVQVDVGLMARVIDNLMENALRFTHAAGRVHAAVFAAGNKVGVSISDDGCGIAPQDLPHIFDRYYQANTPALQGSDAIAKGSVGLGLAIAKQILERHGSSLTVVSTLGVGTRFSFEVEALPMLSSRT